MQKEKFEKLCQWEQVLHQCNYPEYTIPERSTSPRGRSRAKDIDGDEEALKCRRIADLLLNNIQGEDLIKSIQEIVQGGSHHGSLKLAPAPTVPRSVTPNCGSASSRVQGPHVETKLPSFSSTHHSELMMTNSYAPVHDPRYAAQASFTDGHDEEYDEPREQEPGYPPLQARPMSRPSATFF